MSAEPAPIGPGHASSSPSINKTLGDRTKASIKSRNLEQAPHPDNSFTRTGSGSPSVPTPTSPLLEGTANKPAHPDFRITAPKNGVADASARASAVAENARARATLPDGDVPPAAFVSSVREGSSKPILPKDANAQTPGRDDRSPVRIQKSQLPEERRDLITIPPELTKPIGNPFEKYSDAFLRPTTRAAKKKIRQDWRWLDPVSKSIVHVSKAPEPMRCCTANGRVLLDVRGYGKDAASALEAEGEPAVRDALAQTVLMERKIARERRTDAQKQVLLAEIIKQRHVLKIDNGKIVWSCSHFTEDAWNVLGHVDKGQPQLD